MKEESADEAPPPSSTVTASSIFGGARPVDTAAREREIEERLAKEREERLEAVSYTHLDVYKRQVYTNCIILLYNINYMRLSK